MSESSSPSVLSVLQPKPGETVVDCTLGLAGHASAFLKAIGETGHLIGIDADNQNLQDASARLQTQPGRTTFYHLNFRELSRIPDLQADIVFADLGVSSPHFDDPERGFSFRASGPLDLRFDQTTGESAADYLQRAEVGEITKILRTYGELTQPKRAAIALKEAATAGPLTTDNARKAIEGAFGYRAPRLLPQVFQALRIAVNDELGALEALLAAIPSVLKVGGRAGIISYHSLEDRLVKHAFRAWCTPIKDPTTGAVSIQAPFELMTPKAIIPSDKEIAVNPRARSAKFRVVRRRS